MMADTEQPESTPILPFPDAPIEVLGLSARVYHALCRHGVRKVYDLVMLIPKLNEVFGIGEGSLQEIKDKLNIWRQTKVSDNQLPDALQTAPPRDIPLNNASIAILQLSRRPLNAYKRHGIRTVKELLEQFDQDNVRGIGIKAREEVRCKLISWIRQSIDDPTWDPGALTFNDYVANFSWEPLYPTDEANISINVLKLSNRSANVLVHQGITTIESLKHSLSFVDEFAGIGVTCRREIVAKLTSWMDKKNDVPLSKATPEPDSHLYEPVESALPSLQLDEWLADLKDRKRDVILAYFGLVRGERASGSSPSSRLAR